MIEMRRGRWGRGGGVGQRGVSRGNPRGWSSGIAGGVPVVDLRLPQQEPEPEPADADSSSSSSPGLDPEAPAYVAELNPQAAEFRYLNPDAAQHLMTMLASPAPCERVLPGPPDVGHREPHAQACALRPARALPAPPPRRVVYRLLDESDRRAVQRALAHDLDLGELLTAPCVDCLLCAVSESLSFSPLLLLPPPPNRWDTKRRMPRKGGKEFRLERAEMLRLRPGQWLTDPVVNLYTERPQALILFCLVLLGRVSPCHAPQYITI